MTSTNYDRRSDYLAGLDLDQLRPDGITAFVESLPERSGRLIAQVLDHVEASGRPQPYADDAAKITIAELRAQLEWLDMLLADAGLPTRPGRTARRSDIADPGLEAIGHLSDKILGRLSTARPDDWTGGDPTLLDRSRNAVGELSWMLHLGESRIAGHLTAS